MNPVEKSAPIPGKLPQRPQQEKKPPKPDPKKYPNFRQMLEDHIRGESEKKKLSMSQLRRLIKK